MYGLTTLTSLCQDMSMDAIRKLGLDWRLVFPAVLLVCNLGACVVSASRGDYRRAVYWFASAICVAAVSFEK